MRQEAARLPGSPPREPSHRTTRRKIGSKGARWGFLLLCAGVIAACGGADPASDPAGTPDPAAPSEQSAANQAQAGPSAPGPQAQAPPEQRVEPLSTAQVLLDRADQLEHDGFWEAAAEARSLALTDASVAVLPPASVGEAYLAQIRLLLRLDQPGRAGATLSALEASTAQIAETQAALVRGRVLTANGQAERALAAYHAYLDGGGPAQHYALLERARLHAALDELDLALTDYAALRDDPATPALDLESALLEGGLLLENDGRYAEADGWYVELARVSPWISDDAFALHRSGAVRLQRGDASGAAAAWTELLVEFPWHWRAVEAFDGLLGAGVALDPLVEGLYFYRQSRFDDAVFTYNALLAGAPTTHERGVATYYLAAIDEDLGADDAAIEGYLAAVAADPGGPQADDALWWAGRLLEAQESHTLARLLFERLAAEYPDSPFAIEAAFRVPLAYYRDGDLTAAADGFSALTAGSGSEETARAQLWLGKSLDALGDPGANDAFNDAPRTDPNGYHALRAQALAEGALTVPVSQPGPIAPPLPASDSGLREWLNALDGADETTAPAIEQTPDWSAATELWGAGIARSAESRFRLALERTANPWSLVHAARAFDAMGAVHLRLAAAETLLDRLPPARHPTAPVEILRWAYPLGWPDLASASARAFNIDELLIYALIRQESRFIPEAGSIAGALGLTQVIPSTGAEIARSLGDAEFETELLFRPERSIRYGAAYLAAQLTNFEQSVDIALAAYNGGPGNAARWSLGAAALDPDLFYEAVTFTETRSYLRLVQENYAWYQYLYRDAAAPTLLASP